MSLDEPPRPARENSPEDVRHRVPVHVVWELTLACNLKCQHCGSRAGRARPRELTTAESLDLVRRLAALGTREISLIGGEAYLRPDWIEIIREIRRHGIYCAIQTGGRALSDARLQAAVEAGLQGLGVSIDGPPPVHDRIRAMPGCYDSALSALVRAKAAGLRTSANTVVGAPNFRLLPDVMDRIIGAGATHWQVQLAVAMGNAVDHDDLLLQPYQILELMPLLARLHQEGDERVLMMIVGNNVGYFGPYERRWRDHFGEEVHWGGCAAGQTSIGLESDGTIKGCPSLSTTGYGAGNILETPIEELWSHADRLLFNRTRSIDELWGFCGTCYYAEVCRGGCTWTADSLLGRPGNNPYCHYRALQLESRGRRERIVKRREAPAESFAIGEFELIEEPIPGREAEAASGCATALTSAGGAPIRRLPPVREDGLAAEMTLCRECECFIWPDETTCPHCGGDVRAAAARHEEDVRRREGLLRDITEQIRRAREGSAG
jgi:Y-X(10)_GDL-associated radical SAM protein